jgi:hypothetical protein
MAADKTRLINVALRVMASYGAPGAAAEIVENSQAIGDSALIADALPNLAQLATPDDEPFIHDRRSEPGPLCQLYRRQPDAVRAGLNAMLAGKEAWRVGATARTISLLMEQDATLASFMTDDLMARAARAKWLIQGNEGEVDRAQRDIRDVLVAAFNAAPTTVDGMIQAYLPGITPDGFKQLHRIYGDVLRNERPFDEPLEPTEARRVAFQRLLVATTRSDDSDDRNDAVSNLVHGRADELMPILVDQIDHLLGSAALVLQRLEEVIKAPVDPNDPLGGMTRMSLRSRLNHLASTFIQWACAAAGHSGAAAVEKVLKFLSGIPEGSERLRATVIGNFSELARTTEGLKLCLPEFYSALAGSSQLVRARAASALGDMPAQALENMPSLVFEAFTALMEDPYLIVHKAAIKALDVFSLPSQFTNTAQHILSNLIVHYAKSHQDDEFLIRLIRLYARRHADKEKLAGALGNKLIEILQTIPAQTLLHEGSASILAENPNWIDLVLGLLRDDAASEHHVERVLSQIERRPPAILYEKRAKLAETGVKVAQRHLWELPDFVEILSGCGAWAEAATMVSQVVEAIPDTTQNRMRRLHLSLYRIASEFEAALAASETGKLDELAQEWRAARADIEKGNEEIRRREDSAGSVFRTH